MIPQPSVGVRLLDEELRDLQEAILRRDVESRVSRLRIEAAA